MDVDMGTDMAGNNKGMVDNSNQIQDLEPIMHQ
jgi:hypothetical protein